MPEPTKTDKPILYGGQAVIEGVMMRGKRHAAIAIRRADGRIETTVQTAIPWLTTHRIWNKPILRGSLALWDSMKLGVWSLRWSAKQAMKDAVTGDVKAADMAEASGATNLAIAPIGSTGSRKIPPIATGFFAIGIIGLVIGLCLAAELHDKAANRVFVLALLAIFAFGFTFRSQREVADASEETVRGTMGVGLLIGVGLFIALPTLLANAFRHHASGFGLNAIEGAIRLTLFFGYLWLIGKMPGIARLFQYHGAEHRTINAMESGAPLTPEACRPFSVIHPRCGTSFMIFVLLLCTVVYTFFGWHTWYWRLVIRIGLLPLVAGFAYELLRLAGTFRGSAFLNAITWPGRFSQKFTTREPDDEHTAVAIAALNAVLEAERGEAGDVGVPELA